MKKLIYVLTLCFSMLGFDTETANLETTEDNLTTVVYESADEVKEVEDIEEQTIVFEETEYSELETEVEVGVVDESTSTFSLQKVKEDYYAEVLPANPDGFYSKGQVFGIDFEIGKTQMRYILDSLRNMGCAVSESNLRVAPFHVNKVYTVVNIDEIDYTIELVTTNNTYEYRNIDDCHLIGVSVIGEGADKQLDIGKVSEYDYLYSDENYCYVTAVRDDVAFTLSYPYVGVAIDYIQSVGNYAQVEDKDSVFGLGYVEIDGLVYDLNNLKIVDIIKTFGNIDNLFSNDVDILPILINVYDNASYRSSDTFSCYVNAGAISIELESFITFDESSVYSNVWDAEADKVTILLSDEDETNVSVYYDIFRLGMDQTDFDKRLKEFVGDYYTYELVNNSGGGMSYIVFDEYGDEVVTFHFVHELLSGITI